MLVLVRKHPSCHPILEHLLLGRRVPLHVLKQKKNGFRQINLNRSGLNKLHKFQTLGNIEQQLISETVIQDPPSPNGVMSSVNFLLSL